MTGKQQQARFRWKPREGSVNDLPVDAAAVTWGFRTLLGRSPTAEEQAEFEALPDFDSLRAALVRSHEFEVYFSTYSGRQSSWQAPFFLLAPSTVPGLDWRWREPTLEEPGCQLCTAAQYAEPAFAEITAAMGLANTRGRTLWERAWVVSVLASSGLIAPGRRVLVLEPGTDRVPAVLGARGMEVIAAFAEAPDAAALEAQRSRLFFPEAIHDEEFNGLVRATQLAPRAIGSAPEGVVDACWSIGLPHRLGSVAAALDCFADSLVPVRPGGLALHVFDLNIASDEETPEQPGLVLLRRRDMEALAERLIATGHSVLPLTTHPGTDPLDERVKVDASGIFGHRQRHGEAVSAAFGFAVRKAG